MLNPDVTLEQQYERLRSVEAHFTVWKKWNQPIDSADYESGWMSVLIRLLNRRSSADINLWHNTQEQFESVSHALQQSNTQIASNLLDEILASQPNRIHGYYLKESLAAAGSLRQQLLDLQPTYDLDFTSEEGLQLIGFDLAKAHLLLGVSTLQVTLFWISPTDLTEDSIVKCGEEGKIWVWYCYKNRLWAVGSVKNLLEYGTFELVPAKSDYPYNYRQTYPDSKAKLSTRVEFGKDTHATNTVVCMDSQAPTRVTLASTSVPIEGRTHFILATRTRFDHSIRPRLGLYWEGANYRDYSSIQHVPAGTGAWTDIAAVLPAPPQATVAQLRFFYTNTYGEMCTDYVVLVPLPIPILGNK